MPGYNALHTAGGVTGALDGRHAQGGLLAATGPTVLDIRTGVLAGPGSTALVTGTSATGPMTVSIAPHVAVTSRGTANGAYLGPALNAATTVTIAAAPASGSRIDVVYVKQQDTTSGVPSPDVASGPLYGVLQGTSTTGTPTKPSLSSIVGAVELATVTVAAGATSTNGSGVTIANTAAQTVARGAAIPVRNQTERDAIAAAGGYDGLSVRRLDVNGRPMETYDGSSWFRVGGDTGWQSLNLATGFTANDNLAVRRIGSQVVWRGRITRNAGNWATGSFETVGTLPSTFYSPTTLFRALIPGFSSASANGLVLAIGTNSTTVTVGGVGVSTADAYFGNVSYMAD